MKNVKKAKKKPSTAKGIIILLILMFGFMGVIALITENVESKKKAKMLKCINNDLTTSNMYATSQPYDTKCDCNLDHGVVSKKYPEAYKCNCSTKFRKGNLKTANNIVRYIITHESKQYSLFYMPEYDTVVRLYACE